MIMIQRPLCIYIYIYEAKFQVEMCSPDGFKYKQKIGQGKIVKVTVSKWRAK